MSSLIVAFISAVIALVILGVSFGMLVAYPALLITKKGNVHLSLFFLTLWISSAVLVLFIACISSFWNVSATQSMLTKVGAGAAVLSILFAAWQIYTQTAQKKGILR
jgi:hypothetical protein